MYPTLIFLNLNAIIHIEIFNNKILNRTYNHFSLLIFICYFFHYIYILSKYNMYITPLCALCMYVCKCKCTYKCTYLCKHENTKVHTLFTGRDRREVRPVFRIGPPPGQYFFLGGYSHPYLYII